jgi:hypothetical protein
MTMECGECLFGKLCLRFATKEFLGARRDGFVRREGRERLKAISFVSQSVKSNQARPRKKVVADEECDAWRQYRA